MAKANSLGEAVDGLAAGVLFVDAVGRISYANAAATAMLGGGAVSKLGGRVVARNHEANKQLSEVFAAASDGDAAVDKRGVSILLPGDDEDLVAHILPLTSGSRREASAARPADDTSPRTSAPDAGSRSM